MSGQRSRWLFTDLATSVASEVSPQSIGAFQNLEGVTVGGGGSIALVRVNDSSNSIDVVRYDAFNLPGPTATDILFPGNFNNYGNDLFPRNQDQIDLQ